MDLMDLLAGAGNVPLPGLGGGPLPGMGGGVPVQDLSGQPPGVPLPPSMPIAQALAQRPQANSLVDLLKLAGIGSGQQAQGVPIQALRMMLFQQLNQPARGPFTAVVNPIVAALTARQFAPYYQQQQEATLAKQRLDQLQSLAAAQSSVSTAGYNEARAQAIRDENAWLSQLPQEVQEQIKRVKYKLDPTGGEALRADVTREGYTSREGIATEGRKSQEEIARENRASQERQTRARIASQEGIAGNRLALDRQKQQDLQDWREEQKSQFDYGEWYKDRRAEQSEAGQNIRAYENRLATDKREAARIKAQHDRALDTMTHQSLLQAQRLNEVLNSRSDATAEIKTSLEMYAKMLNDDPDGAQGFFDESIVPQWEELYQEKFDIGAPGMGSYVRSVLSPLTGGWVSPPSALYGREKPTTTSTRPPIQPVPVPGRTRPSAAEEQANQMPADNPTDPMGNVINAGKKRKFTLGQ